ncbi:hypothetical protein [Actinoallomurus iriomotensis]|uniref:Uncharacterized protein n=1 Tax=Actinoallomurus iriomotensis TaxID=478107 RepID=A0A9W6W304_9ACTN|nr:hypothetical protein [Actinoallomurus iriomotensis]GLY87486.1 hypothetical protein Airi02_054150 [Actinoallomurus iriomotensis]
MQESDAEDFPCLRSALDALYVTFGSGAGSENRQSGSVRVGSLLPPGEANFDSFMSGIMRLENIGLHKEMLPSVLELLGKEVVDSADYAWLIMNGIAVYWQDWPEGERAAIQVFMRAWWRATLSEFPRRLDVFQFFNIIGTMKIDVYPYLSYWENCADRPAVRHLAWLVTDFTVHGASNARWYDELESWIDSVAPRRILEAALSADPDAVVAQEISSALNIMRSWGRGEDGN